MMEKLLKYTYLLDTKKIEILLEKEWKRYQDLLNKPSWNRLNEARTFLYLIAELYLGNIAQDAIEKRLHLLKKPMSPLDFYHSIDSESARLRSYRKDPLFKKLEAFYRIVKKFKNRHIGGKYYLDEERFIELYNKFSPSDVYKIGRRGKNHAKNL